MSRTRRALLVTASVLVMATIVGVYLGNGCVERRTEGYRYRAGSEVPRRTYAIVLGARVRGGAPSDALLDRLELGRSLYAAHRVDRILVSGDGARDEDGVMARWLVAHGVPLDRVLRDPYGIRTRATMENAAALGIHDAIVCTQPFHLARSVLWAREVGIDAIGLEADYRDYTPRLRDDLREVFARTFAVLEIWRR